MSSTKILLCFLALTLLHVSCDPPKLPLYAGRSYDLLTGNPLSNQVDPGFMHSIFDFTYNKKVTTEDGKYLIPDGVSHRKVSSCTFSTDVRTYRGTQSYSEELTTKATVSGGYNGPIISAAFSASTTYDHVSKETLISNMSITHATAECEAYELSIDIFTVNTLLANFVTGAIESYKAKNWSKFITQFGTHFIYDVTMGGRATQ